MTEGKDAGGAAKPDTEEGDVLAYMDSGLESLSDKDRVAHLWDRLSVVREVYRKLKLAREDASRMGNEETLNRLQKAFRGNYRDRKDSVTALRALGESVDDPFIVS